MADYDPLLDPALIAKRQISILELSQARVIREHLLGDATAIVKLRDIDNNIAALRPKLPKLTPDKP